MGRLICREIMSVYVRMQDSGFNSLLRWIPTCHSSDLHLWSCRGREKGCSLKIASPVISFAGFSLIHLIATGISCFFGSSLLTFVIYVYCQRCQRQSQESTVIHPTTPNHLHYKGNTTPKNEKYTPMEFKVGEIPWTDWCYLSKFCIYVIIGIG